ncbi:hypothetical protein [Streptomyces sp. NPDC002602]|uniref:hypothetical protein n=1 Tax=Streptomyces sp. NPDC002602 TaxID=3364654 RepID=UPI00367EB76B
MKRWERPAAGREPAAAALLGWLADPVAPRLCLVSGSEGCGKSSLLAWLVHHGTRPGTPTERTVHAVVPFAGRSLWGTVWSISEQLGVVTRSPEELVATLKADGRRTVMALPDLHDDAVVGLVGDLLELPNIRLIVEARTGSAAHRRLSASACAELDLNLDQWRDQARFMQWEASLPAARSGAEPSAGDITLDLSDPATVCAADPWLVTAGFEAAGHEEHGGLRAAWRRAGQSLVRDQSSGSRALSLLSVLGDGADPRLAPALEQLADGEPWQVAWSRVRGDVKPPWPGPVKVMVNGQGRFAGSVLLADHTGTVRAVNATDATARGRMQLAEIRPDSVSAMADGTMLMADGKGRVHLDSTWTTRARPSGIAELLDGAPTAADRLKTALQDASGTAIAWGPGPDIGLVALGDGSGTVYTVGDITSSAALHDAAVTDLAVLSLPLDDEVSLPIVYSGGADGTVRAWAPGHDPMPGSVAKRACPVVSVDAALSASGPVLAVAWTDGALSWVHCNTGAQVLFRPGPPIRSVALAAADRVVIGMDEAVTCLTLKAPDHLSGDTAL